MATNERTSRHVASIAARGLADPASLSLAEIRLVCASALTQAPDHNASPPGAHASYSGHLETHRPRNAPSAVARALANSMADAEAALWPRRMFEENAMATPHRLLINALADADACALPWPLRYTTKRSTG